MDIVTLFSFIISLAALLLAFVLEGGALSALLQPTAALIVFGGTIGAIGFSFPSSKLKKVPILILKVFARKKENRQDIIETFLNLSGIARKDGLLALEQELNGNEYDQFIKDGVRLVVDGVDTDALRRTLEIKIDNIEARHENGISIFETAGGYAPTMGVIGTVMGLVHVLGDLSNPDALGGKIAVAFIATLYGVGSANILWLPMATKLKELNNDEILSKQMMLEGILLLQNGSNPALIKEQLKGFLEDGVNEKEEGKERE